MTQPFPSEPHQVDLEEYIAERTGMPRPPIARTAPEDVAAMYQPLKTVLMLAYQQAALGKGKERHASGKPFMRQPMMEICRSHGMGFATGQADKKSQEAIGMVARGEHDAAKFEILGAINYLAGAYLLIDEMRMQAQRDKMRDD
jgi:hypothetical protein